MTKGALWAMALLATVASTAAAAAETGLLADALALDPPEFQLDHLEIRLGGIAAGALFTSSQGGGPARVGGYYAAGVSGLAAANIRVQRTLDNGMEFGARGEFLLYHNDLSSDKYGNDTVERLYLFVQTGFGRAEIGEQDGAAYMLGLVGPLPDEQVSLEKNRNISLFRNPVTGRDFGAFFRQQTNVQSSSNYAKINYVSPRLFGIQVGASFTPEVVRSPLPYTGNPDNGPNRQTNLWEVAASYTGYLSSVAVGLSAGFAHGSLENRTPGFNNLYDWALGAQLAYTISDVKLSAGGAYRTTNAYLLDVNRSLAHNRTQAVHLSAMVERGSWLFGGEYSYADVNGPVDYGIAGYQLTTGYRVSPDLHLSAGWQWYNYHRDIGSFYNGRPGIDMNAGFLSLAYEL
jgi:hypothetical protein